MADEKMAEEYTPSEMPGLGEIEIVAGGGITEEDAVPTMPPPYPDNTPSDDTNAGQVDTQAPGGGLTADDLAQPTSTEDTTGDRATGLMGMRG